MKQISDSRLEAKNYESLLERIFNTPHQPTITLLKEGKEPVKAKKVKDYTYTEEEFFSQVGNRCIKLGQKLTEAEIDTKILKFLHPELDFNAYTIAPVGLGMNIDGLTRVSGGLYKI